MGTWVKYKADIYLALVFFIASHLFVRFFAVVAAKEYGADTIPAFSGCTWDCYWYVSIVQEGYFTQPIANEFHPAGDVANWAFFPAFPLVAMAVEWLGGMGSATALVLTSKLFLLLGLFAFIKLVSLELGAETRWLAASLVAFNPYVIYAHVGYTESLYFFLTTAGFLALRQGGWLWAGLAGAALSATRLVGIMFGLAYGWVLLRERPAAASLPKALLGLLLVPLGLALYMVYLHFQMGDALAFMHVQVAWGRSVQNPLNNLWAGLTGGSGMASYLAMYALLALGVGAWLAWWRYVPYALLLWGATLIPLSTGLTSMPRYVMWQMPLLFGLVAILAKHRTASALYQVVSGGIAGVIALSWFAGKGFVI